MSEEYPKNDLSSSSSLRFWVKKLFTKEDNFNLHKTLGLLVILSFIYRYYYVYQKTDTLGFSTFTVFNTLNILIHIALSCSSIIFHVLKKRIVEKPMIIYEEYRLHAIFFTIRGASLYFIQAYRPWKGSYAENWVLYFTYMFFHLIVDEITRRHGLPNNTTVRNHGKYKIGKTIGTRVYAFYQILATAALLIPSDQMGNVGYNTFIAIQSSAFLMTLFRKGLIPWYVHAIVYTSCLVLSTVHMALIYNDVTFWMKVGIAFLLRTQFNLNKYFLWGLFTLSAYPDVMSFMKMDTLGQNFTGEQLNMFNFDLLFGFFNK